MPDKYLIIDPKGNRALCCLESLNVPRGETEVNM